MIKLIFSLVLIMSASLIGNSFSQRLTNRRRTLSQILNAINRTKSFICFNGADVTKVVEDCFCAEDFNLLDEEYLYTDLPYNKAFEVCVSKIDRSFSLNKRDKELLAQFGTNLGSTDITGQIAHVELYAQLFAERLSAVKEQEANKSKLYRILGFCFGCAISLLVV